MDHSHHLNPNPLIAVVIPTYNRASVIRQAVDSVLTQKFRDFELIVVDDGSQDDTSAILESYGCRLRAIYQPNAGISAARNRGIQHAKAEWVAFLDDDDEYMPDRLAIAANSIFRYPNSPVHATNIALVSEGVPPRDLFELRGLTYAGEVQMERPLEWILRGCFFAQSAVVKKDILVKVGLFRQTFYEDMDLFVRLASYRPWVVDTRRSMRLIRRQETGVNLSTVMRSRPIENFRSLVEIYRRAMALEWLTDRERWVASDSLAYSLFELGRSLLLHHEKTAARACFLEAACTFPRLHSRLKAYGVFLFGRVGFRIVDWLRPNGVGLVR